MPRALRVRAIILAIVMLCVSACGSSAAICANAGGTYADGTCIRAGQAAGQRACEGTDAVYLAGPGMCAYREGR